MLHKLYKSFLYSSSMLVVLGGFLVTGCSDDENDGAPFNTASYLGVKNNTDIVLQPLVYSFNGVSFRMIPVKGSYFLMGSSHKGADDDEKPVHSVLLSDYYIGETEVTQALWNAVMESNPSKFTGNLRRPVECVTWADCYTFISKLNSLTGASFHLPTEAQWEFAARGGTLSKGYDYSGGNYSALKNVAWYYFNSSSSTHPVASKLPNELGLYDMSGNVAEWCFDWYGPYSSTLQINPTGSYNGTYRVIRGGSWYDFSECEVSHREVGSPSKKYSDVGLRLAL